jgi:hypothetical protein
VTEGNGSLGDRIGSMSRRVANAHLGCVFAVAIFFLVAGIVLSVTVPPCGLCCVLPLGIAFMLAAAKHAVDLKSGRIVRIRK